MPAFRQLISYELAWCNFIQLQFTDAAEHLERIVRGCSREQSRLWLNASVDVQLVEGGITKNSNIRGFYMYHRGICLLCAGKDEIAMECFNDVPGLITGKLRPMDSYCLRKVRCHCACSAVS